ncbi:MAG TPA: patatin family protein [Candidatus Avoscillospira avicola]|uniref:Patatin family protein n=1 Tax=Candidatus Avoscillospira avicola TaxID=2840706 RepID=A0A9D1DGG5_9FIRM|nr:patatin family protein [Candidatus Avoscillospira avicola]
MPRTLLLLEGGAYRGIFTAGVLDVLLEAGIYFDAVAGISAGAMCGYHFVGRCHGRVRQVLLEYGNDPRYFSARNLVRSGNSIGDEFMFFDLMEKIPFDFRTFRESSTVFAVGATNCRTGEITYFEKGSAQCLNQCILASSSLPLTSKMIWIDGEPYLDGGVAEHAPLTYWKRHPEYDRVVLVLTRPMQARKLPLSRLRRHTYRLVYGRDKNLLPLLLHEPQLFNQQRMEILRLARAGKLFVLGPDRRFRVERVERNPAILQEGYELGREEAEQHLERLKQYLQG